MEFYHYFPSVTFVELTADQFVGRDDGPLEQLKQAGWRSSTKWQGSFRFEANGKLNS